MPIKSEAERHSPLTMYFPLLISSFLPMEIRPFAVRFPFKEIGIAEDEFRSAGIGFQQSSILPRINTIPSVVEWCFYVKSLWTSSFLLDCIKIKLLCFPSGSGLYLPSIASSCRVPHCKRASSAAVW